MGVQKNIAALKANTESITENLKKLILEEQQTRELALGTLNLLKLMPGYEEALEKMKESVKEDEHQGD
tara:strand:- start:5991 stop:6194 length:204 start_codon:yes stop_codon:yes gene_type:complete